MQVHKELRVGLAVDEILGYYVVRPVREVFVRYRLNLESKAEVGKIFERDGRHSNLIFFSWYFYYLGLLVGLVEILNADYLRDLAFSVDREANRLQTLKLDL